jgi:hypothetical protein
MISLRVYKNMLIRIGQPFCFAVYHVYVLMFGPEHHSCFCVLSLSLLNM